jgi:hypothetical protein
MVCKSIKSLEEVKSGCFYPKPYPLVLSSLPPSHTLFPKGPLNWVEMSVVGDLRVRGPVTRVFTRMRPDPRSVESPINPYRQ